MPFSAELRCGSADRVTGLPPAASSGSAHHILSRSGSQPPPGALIRSSTTTPTSPFVRRRVGGGGTSPRWASNGGCPSPRLVHRASPSPENGYNGGNRRVSPSPSHGSSAGSEMMSRLGLLFGAEARRQNSTLLSARSQDSSSSMKSLEAHSSRRITSSNASPVSTLTG